MRGWRVLGRCVLALLVAAFAAGVMRAFGLDGPHALGVGCAVLAVGLLVTTMHPADPVERVPPIERSAEGRRDLDQLAWSMLERRTQVRKIVLDRVRAVAATRLAARGLDASRPADGAAIEALLGPTAWSVLRPDRERPVPPSAFEATLQALEGLDGTRPPNAPRVPDPNRMARAD